MDEEMIEAMARAISAADPTLPNYDESSAGSEWRLKYDDMARAAHSVIAAKVAELEGALRDLRENIGPASLVRNPTGKRVRDRADAALAQHKGTGR